MNMRTFAVLVAPAYLMSSACVLQTPTVPPLPRSHATQQPIPVAPAAVDRWV